LNEDVQFSNHTILRETKKVHEKLRMLVDKPPVNNNCQQQQYDTARYKTNKIAQKLVRLMMKDKNFIGNKGKKDTTRLSDSF